MQDRDEAARVALRRIYERVDADVAARPGLRCEMSGRCCRFRQAGHELYLTRLEYEEMVARGGDRAADPERCPWLTSAGLCGNREGRALGCRSYHCSDETEAAEVTEHWHREIRRIHEEKGQPYDYRSLTAHMNSG